jgi:hypothetical protein
MQILLSSLPSRDCAAAEGFSSNTQCEPTINVDASDLFFRRPDDDPTELKHVALNVIV